MCLPIDSCFGFGKPRTDDDHFHAPASKHDGGHHYNGNGGHYNGNSYYPTHGAAAGAEADRKASNDVRGTAHHAGAAAPRGWGWHGHAATGAQEKAAYPYAAGAHETFKQQPPAASNGKVAADGHAQPAATATADHESPSEALGGE